MSLQGKKQVKCYKLAHLTAFIALCTGLRSKFSASYKSNESGKLHQFIKAIVCLRK